MKKMYLSLPWIMLIMITVARWLIWLNNWISLFYQLLQTVNRIWLQPGSYSYYTFFLGHMFSHLFVLLSICFILLLHITSRTSSLRHQILVTLYNTNDLTCRFRYINVILRITYEWYKKLCWQAKTKTVS